jgi:predicted Rossmann fold nucleotide-binding protein DprA/Smf involved in DNA uptake
VIDNGPDGLYIDAEINMPSLTETEPAVMDGLQPDCTLVDEIIAGIGLPAGTVSATLTMLQIKGVVKLLPGNRVERNK